MPIVGDDHKTSLILLQCLDQNIFWDKINDLNRELKKVEDAIHKLQQQKDAIEVEMAKPEAYSDFEKLRAIQDQFEKADFKLEEENKKWESIALEIEELENKQ